MIYKTVGVWILVALVILPSWSLLNNGYQNSNFIFQKQFQDKIVLTENIKPFLTWMI